jgi:hypothetical protein
MPQMGKEADTICRNAPFDRPPDGDREVAESGINA